MHCDSFLQIFSFSKRLLLSLLLNRLQIITYLNPQMKTPYSLVDLKDTQFRTPIAPFGTGPKLLTPCLSVQASLKAACFPLLSLLDTNDCCCNDPGVMLLTYVSSCQVLSTTMINEIYSRGVIYLVIL